MIAKTNILELENKGPMKILKIEEKKKNRVKRPKLFNEKDNSPQLFSLLKVYAICNFVYNKKQKMSNKKKI